MNTIQHTTQFMLDYKHAVTNERVSLGEFMKNEKNYDIAFCRAWEEIEPFHISNQTTPNDLLMTLDKIQKCSISHLDNQKQGRAERNFFGISKGYPTDEEGIKDLIIKIWVDKEPFILQVLAEDNLEEAYILTKDDLKYYNNAGQTINIKPSSNDRTKTVSLMFQKIIPCYRKGDCLGRERLILKNHSAPNERETAALKIFEKFLNMMKIECLSTNEKIETIATTMRDLLQQHIYYDGNARSLYILSNFLLQQYGLEMFYPENMCLFDANSKGKMVSEICIGQNRFANIFGDEKALTENLKKYKQTVLDLQELINTQTLKSQSINTLQSAFDERNFNLLLRLSATISGNTTLLKFLLENAKVLNIDITASGKKSGTALDIAVKGSNQEAITLLQIYW
ncbi:unknown protein [Parachlamydia acanthamoebae UV-7]|uniref:Fido domain-containing protein n=1 Tax=Parachlamydia acanthamoebae (strain UV7) TaxID=765952 RepID=F8KZK9_PARAV|nr:hypothetical protein [Parachlamydia acanthamoebae]CCB86349.1 unknown protein [Parachlamydia acanthamoebae UV-7]